MWHFVIAEPCRMLQNISVMALDTDREFHFLITDVYF